MALESKNRINAIRAIVLAGLSSVLLAACGGGAETVDNPITSVTPPVTYQGPPPATADVQAFKLSVWDNVQSSNRCGGCHNEDFGQPPMFARHDDVNIAYQAANTVVDLNQPSNSRLVSKVGSGHNCWLTSDQACADIMTTWIQNWVGSASNGGRDIVLEEPPLNPPGASKSFANATVQNFANLVHGPILTTYCAGCHTSSSPTSQQPYFAEPDAGVAFEAAKSKMDLDDPSASRLVIRLENEFHNCWNVGCPSSGTAMELAIQAFADTVPLTEVDPDLVTSGALTILDGTIASGGNRYENAQIALWEFKAGEGSPTAFDTSGVDPAINLTLSPEVTWFGGWGITLNGGKAQGSTSSSKKLNDLILATGEYSVEAWAIPANVTQEIARIVSYSAGVDARNFSLQQNMYDYDFLNRTTTTGPNGDQPQLSTPADDRVLQATLQHVVATYSPVDGRTIYVNGVVVAEDDPDPTDSLSVWQDTFAVVLGNETSNDEPWEGTLRMVAIHNRALTFDQVIQNFDVGVGEKFFLLFNISAAINTPSAYILFEVSQYDSYGYLFTQPHFITLGATPASVEGVPLEGMRVGINGAEAPVGQSYGKMVQTLSSSQFGELGQLLSDLGAVLPLEKGPADDEFFLTFDRLGTETYLRIGDPELIIIETDLPPAQRIGVRTFDEINATMATVTGVDPKNVAVDTTYQSIRQSLPVIEDPQTFLSSHQVAIAQLAFEYCSELVDGPDAAAFFNDFDFTQAPVDAYAGAARNEIIDPLIDAIFGIAILTQPDFMEARDEAGYFIFSGVPGTRPNNLIDRMLLPNPEPLEPQATTRGIAKGVCGSLLASAAMLLQ